MHRSNDEIEKSYLRFAHRTAHLIPNWMDTLIMNATMIFSAICLDQIEWGRTHQPRKTLFVLTASKL